MTIFKKKKKIKKYEDEIRNRFKAYYKHCILNSILF